MKKYIFLVLLISLILFFFRATTSFRMPPEYNYDSDFGRDLWMTERIAQGMLTLVGPQFSFSGLRLAPYHFYLFAPVLKVFDSYKAVVYANGLLFIAALLAVFMLMYKTYGRFYSFLSVIWIATTAYIILAARSPGNAFTYLAFYLVYFTAFFVAKSRGTWATFILGVLGGVIVNYHPVSILAVLTPFFVKEIFVRDRFIKYIILSVILFFTGFFATFIPVVLFELKHGFVILASFFGPKQAEFLSGDYLKSIGSISHMIYLNELSHAWIPITALGLIAVIAIAYYEKKKVEMKGWFVGVIIISVFHLIFGRDISHYFFPTLLFLQLTAVFFVKDMKYPKIFIIILIAVNLVFLPLRFYTGARNLNQVEENLNRVSGKMALPKSDMNTLLVNETHLSAPGYEYRYLLAKNGFRVDDEYSYNSSRYLLLVSEKGNLEWENIRNWEMQEFGEKRLVREARVKDTVYYLFEKSR